jgi:hypothetical protein
MKRLVPALCVVLSGLCGAQWQAKAQVQPTMPMQASEDDMLQWLRGDDLRMVAWGAHFAARQQEQTMIPELTRLAESWQALPPQQYDAGGNYVPGTAEQRERSDAMEAVLDALIQLHGTVSAEAVEGLLQDFTPQALTLFAFMSEPERTRLAMEVYATRREPGSVYEWRQLAHDQMVHLAAAILAQHPPAGFTASLLNEINVVLRVRVSDGKKIPYALGGGGTCGDSSRLQAASGWPHPWTYVVEERWHQENLQGMQVLVPGDPAITTRRAEGSSSCSTLQWFSSAVRLRLAEQETGTPGGKLGTGTLQYDNIRYPGMAAYDTALAIVVRQHGAAFRELAAALEREGLLTPQEAATAAPTLRVQVLDERENKSDPLSMPQWMGAKVIYESNEREQASPGWLANPY